VNREFIVGQFLSGRIDKAAVHELALNPDNFTGRTDEMILSTLAHEMAHVWQQTYGKPPRRPSNNIAVILPDPLIERQIHALYGHVGVGHSSTLYKRHLL
jgi:hypothetical protein